MSLECLELVAPLGLQLVEVYLHVHERVGTKPEQPHARVLGNTFVFYDRSVEQQFEMAAQRGCGGAELACQLSGTSRSTPEELDNLPSRRVCQGLKYIHSASIFHIIVKYVNNRSKLGHRGQSEDVMFR